MYKFAIDEKRPDKPYIIVNTETSEVMERTDDPVIAGAALTQLNRQAGITTTYPFPDGGKLEEKIEQAREEDSYYGPF